MIDPISESETPGPELVGQTLAGRYRIVQMLGEGAMGAVYLGEHLRIGRRDAIKVLRASLSQDQEAIARFSRGAQNASRVRHPNVCSIYDFGETDDGSAFLAMEYIEGESLQDLLARQGSLPLDECVDIVKQIAGALQAAHDVDIVHRDLKPGNIMVTAGRGGRRVMKVVDFDIAKGSSEGEPADLTRMGFVIGTPEYMSPEQMTADRLDGRSDVYSLGMVLFRMLTGVLPFSARSTREVMLQRLTAAPGKLAAAAPDTTFPEGLQEVIDRALARDPEQRFPDAETFARTLADAAGADSTAAPGNRRDPAPTPRRAAQGAADSPIRANAPVPDTQVAPQRAPVTTRKGTRSWVPVGVGAGVLVAAAAAGWAFFGGSAATDARLTVLPERASIGSGDLLQISAELSESGSDPRAPDQVVWTSSDLAVATVSSTGLVTGVAPGTASIVASRGDLSAASEISVASMAGPEEGSGGGVGEEEEPIPSRLDVETTMITFAASGEADPEPRSISVSGTGISGLDATVNYAGTASGWLEATLSTSQTPARLTLRVDGAALPVGLYEANAALSSSEGVAASIRVMFEKRSADGNDQPGGDSTGPGDIDALLDRQVNRLLDGASAPVLAAARDTAQMVWSEDGAPSSSRAQAAFVIAQAELLAGNQSAALTWAERAVQLAPDNDGYRRLLAGLRGGLR